MTSTTQSLFTPLGILEPSGAAALRSALTIHPTNRATTFDISGASVRVGGSMWPIVRALSSTPGPHFVRFPDLVLLSSFNELLLWKASAAPLVQTDGTRLWFRQGYLGVNVKGNLLFSSCDMAFDDGRKASLGVAANLLADSGQVCPDGVAARRESGTMALDCPQTDLCEAQNGVCRPSSDLQGVFRCRCVS